MRDFRKYNVWQKAYDFSLKIYKLTNTFPKSELYGLISQLRRASVSIPTNFAEGAGRYSDNEFSNFINIASGSAAEVEFLLEISKDLEYISLDDFKPLQQELLSIRKMLNALHIKIKRK